jgi:hypothetical protein
MVKILSCLLFLLLLKASNVWAYCYASQWQNGQPLYSSLYANGDTTLQQCQALACQLYPSIQGCYTPPPQVVTCTYSAVTEFRSCPVNFSGSQTWKSEINCPNGQYGQPMPSGWFKIADTCTPNPPSCRISTETQTLSCQAGYTGAIIQTRSSMCSDPYGQPSWGAWATSSDTCVKSVTNVTNVLSPISPISPTNPTSVVNQSINTPALTTPSVPATVPMSVQTTTPTTETQPQTDTGGSTAQQTESPATLTPAPTGASKTESTQNSNKNTMQTVVGNLIKFEVISQPSIKQYDLFPIISIGQAIPESIRRNQDLYFQFIQGDTVDFGGEQDMRMNAIKQFTLGYENGFE